MSAPAFVYIERDHSADLLVGPYPDGKAATKALDSLLVDSFCEEDALDVYVTNEFTTTAEQVIPDLADPDHT